jgi:predicted transcriptional regulator
MRDSSGFHDLLFELSNENRYDVLLFLREDPKRITDLTRRMNLTTTEVRRHLTRLGEVGLINRDVKGYYYITPYGEASLFFLRELDFLSSFKEYFETHDLLKVPAEYLKQIGKLKESVKVSSPVDYFRLTRNLLKEANSRVWIMCDQFPINLLTSLVGTIEKGVNIKIIEPRERVFEPDLDALTSEESQAYNRTRSTPLYEQGMYDKIPMQLYLSESQSVISFPTRDGAYDYTGITSMDESALGWCDDLFTYIWEQSVSRGSLEAVPVHVGDARVSQGSGSLERITVVGHERPEIDVQAVQAAVDNYDEVILKGTFNFGSSSVRVSRSVVIRGEGRVDGIPSTMIYKKGWVFPFHQFTGVFEVNGGGIDVSIENLYFTDYNCASVFSNGNSVFGKCNSFKFLNNRVTISSGYGRGISGAAFGDFLHGILIEGIGDGGVLVEGNYIDLGYTSFWRGSVARGGLEEDPEYRPDLFNHEYYVGFGVAVNSCTGKVEILNNVVRNASGRGIASSGHVKPVDVVIRGNLVESDVYGAYPMSSHESGAGILSHTGFDKSNPGFSVNIEENTIKLERLNYSGIIVLGPSAEGAGKLSGVIRGNKIQLDNGYEGIHVRKCDDFEVTENTVSGEAYYGVRLSGRRKLDDQDFRAKENIVEDNDMDELTIKEPDTYVFNHSDGKMFTEHVLRTAHFWLDQYTERNEVTLSETYNIIDEGENNSIKYI